MNIWAIADLHLSFARPDRRERYAVRWRDHATRIEAEWRTTVQPGDLVLMPGDLSMAAQSSRRAARHGLARPLAGHEGSLRRQP